MKRILAAIAGATALTAAPAAADTFEPRSFDNLSNVFNAADLDGDDRLSPAEYRAMRLHSFNDTMLTRYSGTTDTELAAAVDQSFATLDRDNDRMVSPAEFMNIANNATPDPEIHVTGWDWQPEYVALNYYLGVNRIDTGEIEDRPLTNLEGDHVGRIVSVIRTDDTNRYFALIDIAGTDMSHNPALVPPETVGIPLSDIMLAADGALMLSTAGEHYLRNTDSMELDRFDTIDYVESISG